MARFRSGQFVRVVATDEVGRIEGISEIGPRAVLYKIEFQPESRKSEWIAEEAVELLVSSEPGTNKDHQPVTGGSRSIDLGR